MTRSICSAAAGVHGDGTLDFGGRQNEVRACGVLLHDPVATAVEARGTAVPQASSRPRQRFTGPGARRVPASAGASGARTRGWRAWRSPACRESRTFPRRSSLTRERVRSGSLLKTDRFPPSHLKKKESSDWQTGKTNGFPTPPCWITFAHAERGCTETARSRREKYLSRRACAVAGAPGTRAMPVATCLRGGSRAMRLQNPFRTSWSGRLPRRCHLVILDPTSDEP